MIDFDNPGVVYFGICLVALVGPVVYSFFIDNHKKGSPDPRKRIF